MATLGPQIVTGSYGNLLKFLPVGEAGVTTSQVQITDGKGKVTPLQLATGSVYVSGTLSSSAEVVFSGLTSNAPGQYVSFDTTTGRLYYSATSSIVPTNALNATSASYAVTASYAVSAAFAPNDGDWTIGSSYMTASGQTSVYIPNRLENGLGNKAVAIESHAEGAFTIANGNYSHAEGRNVSSSGTYSHAEGNETKAQQNYSHAEGDRTVSYGLGAHAEGYQTLASGTYSHAEGEKTLAKSIGSHTEGIFTTASAFYAHAEGKGGVASGEISHAEGHYTVASGWHSHAEGNKTLASGQGAHSGGTFTTASLDYQTVVGKHNLNPQGYSVGFDDTFVVGGGNSYPNRRDRFKVRTDNGEVIIPLGNNENSEWTAGSTQINNSDVSGLIPGLYFGEPLNYNADYSGGGTFRIIAFEKKNDDTGQSTETLRIQQNVGGTYVDTVNYSFPTITAVFT